VATTHRPPARCFARIFEYARRNTLESRHEPTRAHREAAFDGRPALWGFYFIAIGRMAFYRIDRAVHAENLSKLAVARAEAAGGK
jgi:hypothetical protein